MIYFLRKYIIRSLLVAAILFWVVSASLNAINNFLTGSKHRAEKEISGQINQKVSVGNIKYYFPATASVEDIRVFRDSPLEETAFFSIKKVKLAFSIPAFITQRVFLVSAVNIDGASGDYLDCISFLKKNIQKLADLLKNLPQDKFFNLGIKNAYLKLPQKGNLDRHVGITAFLKAGHGYFLSSGSINLTNVLSGIKPETLQYDLKGYLTSEGFALDSLEVSRKYFYAKLWGIFEKSALRFNGFLSLSSGLSTNALSEKTLPLIDRFKSLAARHQAAVQVVRKPMPGLNLFDMSGVAVFTSQNIEIESLKFSLKDIPFYLKGNISFSATPSINISSYTYYYQPPEERGKNPLAFDLNILGDLGADKFNGKITLGFARNVKNKTVPQKIESAFKNAAFKFRSGENLDIYFDEADFKYFSGNNMHGLFFRDFNALFNIKERIIRMVGLNSLIYDGRLSGEGKINIDGPVPQCEFNLDVKKVSADELKFLSVYFSKVEGMLDSRLHYQNYPQPSLSGVMNIANGRLNNFEFFKWLADFFGMPSLSRIGFNRLSADFLVDDTIAKLDNINLESLDVGLEGYFGISTSDLASSILLLRLSKNIIKDSAKFKPLLRLLRDDFSFLDFDFQLSGLSSAMNFKWLKSDFKRKIQDAIPGFIERSIERKVEEAIEAIALGNGDTEAE
ncbi:MAG: AsmA-like C-terminal region-containing protein [Candidatus Omnitrophota bacterium]|nr:AsmA-like C-terminal region-containing protein [Candidatus Omnitrophota bacterium]